MDEREDELSTTHNGCPDDGLVAVAPGCNDERSTTACQLCVLIPVFNDWQAAALVIAQLDQVLHARGMTADLIIVDDASTSPPHPEFLFGTPVAICRSRCSN